MAQWQRSAQAQPLHVLARTGGFACSRTRECACHHCRVCMQAVDGLIAISDYYRRRVLQHMCQYRYVGQTRQACADGRGPPRRTVTALGAMVRHMARSAPNRDGRLYVVDDGAVTVCTCRITTTPMFSEDPSELPTKRSMPTQLVMPPRQREPSAGDLVQHVHGMQGSDESMDKAGTKLKIRV